YPSPGTITLNGGLLQVLWLAIGSFFWRRTRVVAVPAVKVIYDQKQRDGISFAVKSSNQL
ncbi:MAG: hypothetical protein ACRCWL_12645, partial [Aeromonas sp.]